MSDTIKNRYDFVVYFDVENGNPNGDPDAGNMPRIDPETSLGIVTDVCLKRKIRNYVETVKEGERGFEIYIKDGVPLNASDRRALDEFGVGTDDKAIKKLKKDDPALDEKIRDFMCETFYDVRTFGAVMTTFVKGALNCGQVRGPVQLTFARSVDPIIPQEVTITRVAITTEADAEKKGTEMGRKYVVPYALYRGVGLRFGELGAQIDGILGGRPRPFCGMLSSTCSSTITRLRAARWRFARSWCSNMTASLAMRRRTSCSTLFQPRRKPAWRLRVPSTTTRRSPLTRAPCPRGSRF